MELPYKIEGDLRQVKIIQNSVKFDICEDSEIKNLRRRKHKEKYFVWNYVRKYKCKHEEQREKTWSAVSWFENKHSEVVLIGKGIKGQYAHVYPLLWYSDNYWKSDFYCISSEKQ